MILITPETLQFTRVSVRSHFTQLCTQHIKYLPQAGELRDTLLVFVLAAIIAPVKVRAAKSDRLHVIRQTQSFVSVSVMSSVVQSLSLFSTLFYDVVLVTRHQ